MVTIIHLGTTLPSSSCDLPGCQWPGVASRQYLAYTGRAARVPHPYLVLLRMGFTLPPPSPPERCALTAPFHPYPVKPGGLLSVALSVALPRLAVSEHAARRSPDFPPPDTLPRSDRLEHSDASLIVPRSAQFFSSRVCRGGPRTESNLQESAETRYQCHLLAGGPTATDTP